MTTNKRAGHHNKAKAGRHYHKQTQERLQATATPPPTTRPARCLGPGEDHYFMSEGPHHRICDECRAKVHEANLSKREMESSTVGWATLADTLPVSRGNDRQ